MLMRMMLTVMLCCLCGQSLAREGDFPSVDDVNAWGEERYVSINCEAERAAPGSQLATCTVKKLDGASYVLSFRKVDGSWKVLRTLPQTGQSDPTSHMPPPPVLGARPAGSSGTN